MAKTIELNIDELVIEAGPNFSRRDGRAFSEAFRAELERLVVARGLQQSFHLSSSDFIDAGTVRGNAPGGASNLGRQSARAVYGNIGNGRMK